ncbi:alpha/beta hydrolase fold-domain-containing protein [Cunninghamella echinulata]|nr:alpha/beta hydrolase fold-domain-containing protein [Cunninghamella echinulata]
MTSNKKVPPHPTYDAIFKAMRASGFSWIADEPAPYREKLDNLPLPPNVVLPDTLMEKKEITIDLQNTGGLQTSSTLKLIITRPPGTENKNIPALIYFIRGGFRFGSFRVAEKFIKDITVQANVAVIFVCYSLAPEVKFPVATEECYSSILWIHQHANELKVDSSKLVVGGDSAGGNLSAVSSILLKKRGYKDILKGQILIYPTVDLTTDGYESCELYGGGDYMLSKYELEHITRTYLGNDYKEKEWNDIRLRPIIATDEELSELPRALVITAECDILRDEGEDYAHRLLKAGVKTTAIRSLSASHGFMTAFADTENYIQCLGTITKFINDSF